MIIEISATIRFRYDAGNYILEKKSIVGESQKTKAENIGAIRWDAVGYYGDLETAAKSLLKRHFQLIKDEAGMPALRDLKDLTDAVAYGGELIAKACAMHKPEKAVETNDR